MLTASAIVLFVPMLIVFPAVPVPRLMVLALLPVPRLTAPVVTESRVTAEIPVELSDNVDPPVICDAPELVDQV